MRHQNQHSSRKNKQEQLIALPVLISRWRTLTPNEIIVFGHRKNKRKAKACDGPCLTKKCVRIVHAVLVSVGQNREPQLGFCGIL